MVLELPSVVDTVPPPHDSSCGGKITWVKVCRGDCMFWWLGQGSNFEVAAGLAKPRHLGSLHSAAIYSHQSSCPYALLLC